MYYHHTMPRWTIRRLDTGNARVNTECLSKTLQFIHNHLICFMYKVHKGLTRSHFWAIFCTQDMPKIFIYYTLHKFIKTTTRITRCYGIQSWDKKLRSLYSICSFKHNYKKVLLTKIINSCAMYCIHMCVPMTISLSVTFSVRYVSL